MLKEIKSNKEFLFMTEKNITFRTGLGQDSHRFLNPDQSKPLILAGLLFDDEPGLAADSDGDVVLHALCNSITSITHAPILGKIAKELFQKDGITDSAVYVKKALQSLSGWQIENVAIALEAKSPRMQKKIEEMRQSLAEILQIDKDRIGITVTSGEGLTDFGCGEGIQCFCSLLVKSK